MTLPYSDAYFVSAFASYEDAFEFLNFLWMRVV
jgi:hypothetical protein